MGEASWSGHVLSDDGWMDTAPTLGFGNKVSAWSLARSEEAPPGTAGSREGVRGGFPCETAAEELATTMVSDPVTGSVRDGGD